MNPRAFDLYVRTLTTAFLALSITGAALYAVVAQNESPPLLIGWAGIVIGGYLGAHIAHNGRAVQPRRDDYEMTVLSSQPPPSARPHTGDAA